MTNHAAMTHHSSNMADYSFLAHPPQKRPVKRPAPLRPTCSPTNRRRSSAFSGIVAWASHVQPGSPGSLSPHSPYSRTSLGECRRPSISSTRIPSNSFLQLTPTPTTFHINTPICDFKTDLTTVGYTSAFLRLPNTPISATIPFSVNPPTSTIVDGDPVPPVPTSGKPRRLTRFRSLSALRSRGRSRLVSPNSPTKMKSKSAAVSAAIVKRKKAKYAMRPPPLSNELALMQFADGGSMHSNIQRVVEMHAKAVGAVGLTDIYRDGEGGIWFDQDEEWEYTHLLAEGGESRPSAACHSQWVTFDGNAPPSTACTPESIRRGSLSSQNSDLNSKCVVQSFDLLGGDDPALFRSSATPLEMCNASTPFLSLPSRSRRPLRKAELLADMVSHPLDASLSTPTSPVSPGASREMVHPGSKTRRRPRPLKLSPPSPAFKLPINSPIWQDFMESSFEPTPISVSRASPATPVSVTAAADVPTRLPKSRRVINLPWRVRAVNDGLTRLMIRTNPSMLNMRGLFRTGKGNGEMS